MPRNRKNHGHAADDLRNFILDDLPNIGERVEVLGKVGEIQHVMPFLCSWTEEGWVISGSRRLLACNVVGWRRTGA